MLQRKKHPFLFILTVLIFFAVIIFSGNGIIDISIKNATPLLALPLLCGFAVFHSLEASVIAGLLTGIMLDSISVGTYCFNAIILLVIGCFVNLASNSLFNKNLKAASALSVISCFAYFIGYWLCFAAFGRGIENSLTYLLSYGIPSAVYSAVFVIPFYFIFRYFNKLRS